MFKPAGNLPVKTRLPAIAWIVAGLVTLVSWVSEVDQLHHPGPQLANMAHSFSIWF